MKIKGDEFRNPKFNKKQKERIKKEIKNDNLKNFWPVIRTKECCEKTGRIILKNIAVSFYKVNELGNEIKLVDIRNTREWLRVVSDMKFSNMEEAHE